MVIDKVLIVVSAVIKNRRGAILLLKRDNTKNFKGYWQLPEGKLEKNEKPQDALKRELKEELDVYADIMSFENISQSNFKVNKIKYLVFRISFKARLKRKKITLSGEHSNYKWVKRNEMINLRLLPGILKTVS